MVHGWQADLCFQTLWHYDLSLTNDAANPWLIHHVFQRGPHQWPSSHRSPLDIAMTVECIPAFSFLDISCSDSQWSAEEVDSARMRAEIRPLVKRQREREREREREHKNMTGSQPTATVLLHPIQFHLCHLSHARPQRKQGFLGLLDHWLSKRSTELRLKLQQSLVTWKSVTWCSQISI